MAPRGFARAGKVVMGAILGQFGTGSRFGRGRFVVREDNQDPVLLSQSPRILGFMPVKLQGDTMEARMYQ